MQQLSNILIGNAGGKGVSATDALQSTDNEAFSPLINRRRLSSRSTRKAPSRDLPAAVLTEKVLKLSRPSMSRLFWGK
ncbi:hypothetical protein ACWAU3_07965 [Shewanella sp. JL219SE-S6]